MIKYWNYTRASGDEPNIVLNTFLLNEPLTMFNNVVSLNQGVA